MSIVAILVDGGFFLKRANYLWGAADADERADQMRRYCMRHINKRDHLYRIFYYDCPPSAKQVYHPLLGRTINLGATDLYKWMNAFQDALRSKRKLALRLGRLSETGIQYLFRPELTKKICSGAIKADDLTEEDFYLNIMQKGVDMRIGLDISSMAFKKQVNKMILISGDSDFVPAAKLARREGIDFVLDPMGAPIRPDLNEHIDGLVSPSFVPTKKAMEEEALSEEVSDE